MLPELDEIPPRFWKPYFDSTRDRHQGWRVTVEVLGEQLGDQRVVEGLPLRGLTSVTKGSEKGAILIEAGDGALLMIHRVAQPRRVLATQMRPGVETDLLIESVDGTATLIVLRCLLALPPGAEDQGP